MRKLGRTVANVSSAFTVVKFSLADFGGISLAQFRPKRRICKNMSTFWAILEIRKIYVAGSVLNSGKLTRVIIRAAQNSVRMRKIPT